MASSYTTQFILDCCDKYEKQTVKKIQNQSNFQLIFTHDKVYNLDSIILLKTRDNGSTGSTIHVIEKNNNDDYADVALVFLAIDHLLFNTDKTKKYIYEQGDSGTHRELRPVIGINNIITYNPYDNIKEVPNFTNKIKAVLDPTLNSELMQYLYEQIPNEITNRDGLIQMNTNGDKNFFDILDI